MQQANNWSIKRILVPLDASLHSRAALEAAVKLAASFDAELMALFVEDISLINLTEFPFSREICAFSPGLRPLERTELERQLRVQAGKIQQLVASQANQYNLKWNFKVVRGGVPAQILAAQAEADLTILGKTGWSLAGSSRVGSTVQTIISSGKGLTMIFQKGIYLEIPILVIYTGSDLSQKALEVGTNLAHKRESSLTVIILAKDRQEFEELQKGVHNRLNTHNVSATIRYMKPSSLYNLQNVLQWEGRGPLVIPREEPFFSGQALENLLNLVSNPVVLVQDQREKEEV